MGNVYFYTGFPGFLARSLIRKMIDRIENVEHIYLLILPEMKKTAELEINQICTNKNISANKFTLVSGDITATDLKIESNLNDRLKNSVTHVFHLAAVYDLAVKEEVAEAVNVTGTYNVNEWVKTLKQLKRYNYFSTAYVSGKREGKIYENELSMGQSFKNHYERTKYKAEILVDELKSEVPLTIFRPGIVRGHSVTGETIKFDGPYFMLHILHKFRHSPFVPQLSGGHVEGNFVPVDYVIDATTYLSHQDKGEGKTYHLTDPNPYKMSEVYTMLMQEYLGKTPKGKFPLQLAHTALSSSVIRKWINVEKEALDYFRCNASYDTAETERDLKGSGINCPTFDETLQSMVQYYRENQQNKQLYIAIS
ncbi:SDR family oxidoreductase [Bacillus shivajii]|uniref:SDR family oxidoreductase n=1 Tax=Bacillus shivajii TaxID=1983719 RepID=UPI001CF9646F|nr:SDR family oxidoreductase [Bacillus shivajii]UCZ54922.1 SDR family oxidoreductase [Bacillus shivajii]